MFQKKSLGQNFLTSKKILGDIVTASQITPGETIIEAGPGKGTLTEELLRAGAKVIAIEKDHRLITFLQEKFANQISNQTFTLIEGDILDFSYDKKYKIVANIPYYITGQFFRKFFETDNQPSQIVVLIQKEVAERIVTRDGKESILSISVKAYGEPHFIATVKAGNFNPPPSVDSAIISIEHISKKFFDTFSEEKFFDVVKKGFAHKRKKLLSNIGATEVLFTELGLPIHIRAEELSLSQWKNLVSKL